MVYIILAKQSVHMILIALCKLEVNCANITSECNDLPSPDCISQELDAGPEALKHETLKKK